MAIRDVKVWRALECRLDRVDGFFIANRPRGMSHTVGAGEIDFWFCFLDLLGDLVDCGNRFVGKKNGAGLTI